MKPYMAAFRARARAVFQYRAAAFAGIFTQFFFGFVIVMILESWYSSGTGASEAPLSLSQAASYVWLGQAFFSMLPWNPDPELRDLIRSGDVARDLMRPLDLYFLWFIRTLAWRLVMVALRCFFVFAIGCFVLPVVGMADIALSLPSPGGFLCFLALMPMAALLSAAITVGVSCFQFRQVSQAGATAIMAAVVSFFSGLTVPLPLLSGGIDLLARALPFRLLADAPYRFWLGSLQPQALPGFLALQAFWLAAIVIGGRAFMNRRLAGLSVAGG